MRPRNIRVTEFVSQTVESKINDPSFRPSYHDCVQRFGVNSNTLARYVCIELKKRHKSISEQFHVKQTDAKIEPPEGPE